jgi:hypothetical protein
MNQDFTAVIAHLDRVFQSESSMVHTDKWQGFDISKMPEAAMHELTNVFFTCDMLGENLDDYRQMIKPNLPWADDHFAERVCGIPLNPGETWKTWPWANKADQSRIFNGKFSHTYFERYWPRWIDDPDAGRVNMRGHRFEYGDLNDVVALLANEPLTRQAYLPIFFPEDTGARHGNRVPCTLGYHWMLRQGKLHTFYPIRSCDYYRHFFDDIYLTARLTLWLLDQLRAHPHQKGNWREVQPGTFSMWIGSLHMFRNDYIKLFGAKK